MMKVLSKRISHAQGRKKDTIPTNSSDIKINSYINNIAISGIFTFHNLHRVQLSIMQDESLLLQINLFHFLEACMEKNTATTLLFETELRHIFDSEHQIYDNLTLLIESATLPELKSIFRQHQIETKHQIHRLLRVFDLFKIEPESTILQSYHGLESKGKEFFRELLDLNFTGKSKGTAGILSEGKELVRHFGDTEVNNLALCGSGQKVEHFEIACYSQLIFLAEMLDKRKIVALLHQNLREEEAMNVHLTEIAHASVVEVAV